MSDPVKIAIITGLSAAIPPIVVGVLIYVRGRKTINDIHTLVNSQMGQQLMIGMVSARTLAETTPTPENQLLAVTAEEKYREHQAKQSRVDNPNP